MPELAELYTSGQAREKLGGISSSTFKSLVDSGKIRKITPPGRKQGMYLKEDVDKAAQEIQLFRRRQRPAQETAKNQGATDWIQTSDLPYILAYDLEMYGIENTVDISITHAWWKKNPHMCRILYDKEDRRNIWGVITIMPMEEPTIFKLLKGEMREQEITPDDILTYEPGRHYFGYVASASVKPEHRPHLRRLIQEMLQYWCDQYPHMHLRKLYAVVTSDEGWKLVKHLFFAPRYDLGPNAFELDLHQRNPSRLVTAFQDCLARKQVGEEEMTAEVLRNLHPQKP